MKYTRQALTFLEKTQMQDFFWEMGIGTDMFLLTFNEIGLTIESERVRRDVDYNHGSGNNLLHNTDEQGVQMKVCYVLEEF